MFKGYKTVIFNLLTAVIALSEVTGFMALIPAEYLPVFLLVVAMSNLVLRYLTDTNVFSKTPKTTTTTVTKIEE